MRIWKVREGIKHDQLARRYLRLPTAALVLSMRSYHRTSDRKRRGVERLSAIVVVNLDRRSDRLATVAAELQRVGIHDFVRLSAIETDNGILGCTLSHAAAVRLMIDNDWPSMMVCEDDVRFDVSRKKLDVLIDEFLDDSRGEVACLAYWHRALERHSLLYLRATRSTTTACYLLKSSIAQDLEDVWRDGARHLLNGEDRHVYGVDVVWTSLQKTRVFLIPVVRAAHQAAGYSDVWGEEVDFDY